MADGTSEDALPNPMQPFVISLLAFVLVSINTLLDLYNRLIELGTSDDNLSRTRLSWSYFSASFTYILKVLVALFVMFAMVTLIAVIMTSIFSLVSSGNKLKQGSSKDEIIGAIIADARQRATLAVKYNIEYLFSYVLTREAFTGFLIVLPLYMFIFMAAFALSIYRPTLPSVAQEEGPKKSIIMSTLHQYIYYLFVIYVFGVIIFVLYTYAMKYMMSPQGVSS